MIKIEKKTDKITVDLSKEDIENGTDQFMEAVEDFLPNEDTKGKFRRFWKAFQKKQDQDMYDILKDVVPKERKEP